MPAKLHPISYHHPLYWTATVTLGIAGIFAVLVTSLAQGHGAPLPVVTAQRTSANEPYLAQSTAAGGLVGLIYDFSAQSERAASYDSVTGGVQVIGAGAANCCDIGESNAAYDTGTHSLHAVMAYFGEGPRFFTINSATGAVHAGPLLRRDLRINYMVYDPKLQQLVGLAHNETNGSQIPVHINSDSGELTRFGDEIVRCCGTGLPMAVPDAGIDPVRRRLYVMMKHLDEDALHIFTFDVDSGRLLSDPLVAVGWTIHYFAVQPATGRIYALAHDPARRREFMVEVNPKTGGITAIGAGVAECCSINAHSSAFDAERGLLTVPLYYLNGDHRLMTWNVTTGTVLYQPKFPADPATNFLFYDPQLPPLPTPTPVPTATPTLPPVLAISKSAPSSVAAGEHITYLLTVANVGGSAADSVTLSDLLPPAATPLAISTGGTLSEAGQPARANAAWALGSLAPGTSRAVSVTVAAEETLVNDTYSAQYGAGNTVSGTEPVLTLVGAETTSGTADVSAGLVITNGAGSVMLDVPAGAVTTTAAVQLTTAWLRNASFSGPVFEATATDAAGTAISTFEMPLTITVFYSDADWQDGGTLREEDLNVFYWQNGSWHAVLPCPGCVHDLEGNKFVLRLDHLTMFAVRGRTLMFLSTVGK